MRILYLHASVFGNGRQVAERFRARAESRGIHATVEHVDDVDPRHLPPAELYVFSSPGRMGRPRRKVRRFLARVQLPRGTRYALLTTEAPHDPSRDESTFQHVRDDMHALLADKGLVSVAASHVHVVAMRGPLEEGWEGLVDTYVDRLLARALDRPPAEEQPA